MSRHATLLALTATLALGVASLAEAGNHCDGGRWRPAPIHPAPPAPTAIPQVRWMPPVQQVVPTRRWYFGMSLQITNTAYGRGLQVTRVTPGGPAARVGLEPGDVLMAAGQVSLQTAYSNEHGVQLLQSAVGFGSPAPTAAITTIGFPSQPSSSVLLTVINRRTNQPLQLAVSPQRVGGGGPVPTTTVSTFSSRMTP